MQGLDSASCAMAAVDEAAADHRRHADAPPPRRRPADRPYLLERVDDAAVVQLYADGFANLPLKDKTLIWHLSQAAIAGRDIFYDQRYAHNLEMRDILEAHRDARRRRRSGDARGDSALHEAVLDQHRSLQQPDRAQVRPDVHAARRLPRPRTRQNEPGATFPLAAGESLDQLLARLQPQFFDPNVDPMVTAKTPPPGTGHPHRQRQQSLRGRVDEGSRRVSRSSTRSTRGS